MRGFAKLIATAGLGMFMALAATLQSADAQSKDKVVLLLNWYNYGEHAPFYLGLAKGYFAEENIDLEIQEGRGSGITIQAVAAGSAAFGYADTGTMIKAAAKGAPVKAVGVLLQKSPMAVMGFAEQNVATPADIKGKTVAVTPGDSLSQLWPVFLKLNNLSDKDFKTITGDATTKRNAVVNGQADLLLGNANDQKPIIEETTGKPVRALLFADSGVNTLNAGIIVQKELIQKNPDLIRRFMRAATRAVEATAKAPDEAVAAMLKINAKAGKPETLRKSLDITLPLYHTAATATRRPFDCDPKDMATTLDMLAQYGGVDPSSKGRPEDYYTLEFLPK
jgi:NitT/TauT family transport system substrate-binding protein